MPDQFVMGATLRFQTRILIWLGPVVLVDVAASGLPAGRRAEIP
jgi:hypothetical protein